MVDWYMCKVIAVGYSAGGILLIRLREGKVKFEGWYEVEKGMENWALSIALTAISSGLPVAVQMDKTDQYAQINRIFVEVESVYA